MSGMRNIKTSRLKTCLKSVSLNKHNLAFRCECCSRLWVSGHSSEQSKAHFSSRPTVSQLKGVSDTISNIWESPTTEDTFSPPLTLLSVQNSNRMASRFTTIASFPSVFLQFLQCSAHWAALMTKTDLNYPAFSLRLVEFAVQFWFHCPGPITILCYA